MAAWWVSSILDFKKKHSRVYVRPRAGRHHVLVENRNKPQAYVGFHGFEEASVQSDPPIRTGIETYLSTRSDRVLARTFAVLRC